LPFPPELEPPTYVPPRRGRERLQRVILAGAILVLILIGPLAFLVVTRLIG
jgi:hypothetical protein